MKLFILIVLLFLLIELVLHILTNRLRDKFADRVNWHKGRLITNLITSKDIVPFIAKKGLYSFAIYFYDSVLGSVTKPNIANVEKHETAQGKVVTTKYSINSFGSRSNPGHEHLPTDIACFGDSITFCRHVNDDQSWQFYLSELTEHNVTNFAVGNYGVDQAFLRFKREADNGLEGSIVLIGIPPETIRRSLSCWKHYFEFGNVYNFKPRFKLEKGELKLVPNFMDNLEKYLNLKDNLKMIKKNDFFYKKKFKKYLFTFPYLFSIVRSPVRKLSLLYYYGMTYLSEIVNVDWTKSIFFPKKNKIINGIKNIGGLYFDFQDKIKYFQKAEIVGLTAAIIKAFSDCIRQHNKIPYVVVLPTKTDLEYIKKTQHIYYQSLIGKVSDFVGVVDVGKALVKADSLDNIFADTGYGAHYNSEGNKVVARTIYEFIKK